MHFAEGNVTALVAQALDLARLADLVTGAKVERIERMMNVRWANVFNFDVKK